MGTPALESELEAIRSYQRIVAKFGVDKKNANEAFKKNLPKLDKAKDDREHDQIKADCEQNLSDAQVSHDAQMDMIQDLETHVAAAKSALDERKKWVKEWKEKWKGTLKMVKDHNEFVKEFKKSPSGKSSNMKPINVPKSVDKMLAEQEQLVAESEKKIADAEKVFLPAARTVHQSDQGVLQTQRTKLTQKTTPATSGAGKP